jgi:predicted LPLAT superfamily acyltransferase
MRKITETFGLRTAYFFLNFIVPYFYLFAPRARRGLHEYWKLQIPDAAYGTRVRLVVTQFYRFGQVLIDRLYQSHKSTQVFKANSHGIKNIVEPMSTNGIVLIGAHVGGWDIAARYLEWHGLNGSFHPVQLVAEGNTFEKTLNPQEKTAVKKVITNRTALPIFEIRHMLSQSRPVGLMCDRPLTGNFELVPFLGKLAPFDTTAFRIAAATKSPVIFSLGFKSKHSGEYDFFATPPKSMEYSSLLAKEDQIKMWIAEFSIFLEERLKDYPEQWFNFFEFWSSVPETLGV